MYIDLQLHSTYSDGYLTPSELVDYMVSRGIEVASLTDHNTVAGIDEFRRACKKKGVKAIPGLELYARCCGKRINLLWYNFDIKDPELHEMLRASHLRRKRSARTVMRALVAKGFKLDIDEILDSFSRYVPVNHLVDALMSVPSNANRIRKELKSKRPFEGEIIREYFKNENDAVLTNSRIDAKRIFELRKKIGGQIILCHPAKHSYLDKKYLTKMKKMGLDGIELFSPHHSYGSVMHLQQIATELDLICTGGSDFHRYEGGMYFIQHAWQYYHIRASKLRGIKKVIGNIRKKKVVVKKKKVVKKTPLKRVGKK